VGEEEKDRLRHEEENIARQQTNTDSEFGVQQKNDSAGNKSELKVDKEEDRLRRKVRARKRAKARQEKNARRKAEARQQAEARQAEKKKEYFWIFIAFSLYCWIVYELATRTVSMSELMMHFFEPIMFFFFWTSIALMVINVGYVLFVYPFSATEDSKLGAWLAALALSIVCLVISVAAYIGGFLGACLIMIVFLALSFWSQLA